MSAKRPRAFRAGLERLERRETPSGHIAAAATAAKVIDLESTGSADVTAAMPTVNAHQVTINASGSSKALGKYSAELTLFYQANGIFGVGTGTVTTSTGDQIDLSLSSRIQAPTHVFGSGGVINFKVAGGTGAFAKATGHGSITGNVNELFPFRYALHGRIRE